MNNINYIEKFETYIAPIHFNTNSMGTNIVEITGIYTPNRSQFIQNVSQVGELTIPGTINDNKVVGIGINAFSQYSSLTSIILPKSIANIGNNAFSDCTSLRSINIPDNVITIGYQAFNNCTSLTNITIPVGIISIDNYAFRNCIALINVTFEKSMINVGNSGIKKLDNVFNGCSSLRNITLLPSVTSINGTFQGCTALSNITIPPYVTNLDATFTGCSSLKTIKIPYGITSIGYRTFADCTDLSGIILLPSTVSYIDVTAFDNCSFWLFVIKAKYFYMLIIVLILIIVGIYYYFTQFMNDNTLDLTSTSSQNI